MAAELLGGTKRPVRHESPQAGQARKVERCAPASLLPGPPESPVNSVPSFLLPTAPSPVPRPRPPPPPDGGFPPGLFRPRCKPLTKSPNRSGRCPARSRNLPKSHLAQVVTDSLAGDRLQDSTAEHTDRSNRTQGRACPAQLAAGTRRSHSE